MSERQRRKLFAVLAFLTITFVGSWGALALFLFLGWSPTTLAGLFTRSLLYALIMGWPPFVGAWVARRWIDPSNRVGLGITQAKPRVTVLSAMLALALVLLCALVAGLIGDFGPLLGSPQAAPLEGTPTLGRALLLLLAFLGSLSLLWVQSLTEEVGWRGYFLVQLMRRFGRWGVLVHGVFWGLWYAPLFLLVGGFGVTRIGSFVLSFSLLGALFAWLRLGTKSIVPAVTANITITIATGLPYLLYGAEVGVRSAIFGPAGWVLMGGVLIFLLLRFRHLLQVSRLLDAVQFRFDANGDRLLH